MNGIFCVTFLSEIKIILEMEKDWMPISSIKLLFDERLKSRKVKFIESKFDTV